jgi:uncharacterized membrane protein YkvA (DUF1232 family)
MTNASVDSRYLEVFSQWLRSLGEDTTAVGAVIASSAPDDAATRWLVAGINYIFKSLDLIPDGVDDLGYLDDAFVLRVASALAVAAQPEVKTGVVERLADDARAVRDFLEGDFGPLEAYVRGLAKGAARGRTVDEIVSDAALRADFLHDVVEWAKSYQPPAFGRDPKTLLKLRSFLAARLA